MIRKKDILIIFCILSGIFLVQGCKDSLGLDSNVKSKLIKEKDTINPNNPPNTSSDKFRYVVDSVEVLVYEMFNDSLQYGNPKIWIAGKRKAIAVIDTNRILSLTLQLENYYDINRLDMFYTKKFDFTLQPLPIEMNYIADYINKNDTSKLPNAIIGKKYDSLYANTLNRAQFDTVFVRVTDTTSLFNWQTVSLDIYCQYDLSYIAFRPANIVLNPKIKILYRKEKI